MASPHEQRRLAVDHPPPPVRTRPSPDNLRTAVQECRACDLWDGTTQAVMGEGARGATLMLVGEQPGDREAESARSSGPHQSTDLSREIRAALSQPPINA